MKNLKFNISNILIIDIDLMIKLTIQESINVSVYFSID